MNTCSAYHSSNFILRKSLAGLLTLRSKGGKWSVQIGWDKNGVNEAIFKQLQDITGQLQGFKIIKNA